MMGMLMMDPDDVHCHALNIHSKLAALINEQCVSLSRSQYRSFILFLMKLLGQMGYFF